MNRINWSEMDKLDWTEQMRVAMTLMIDACNRNGDEKKCSDCPFDKYCQIILDAGKDIPAGWVE